MANLKWFYEDLIATITLSNPPANALSSFMLKEISDVLDEVEKNDKG
jgi:enoyl-CoA hydratase